MSVYKKFWYTYYQEYKPSTDVFIFQPHTYFVHFLYLGKLSRQLNKILKISREDGILIKNLYLSKRYVWCTKAVAWISGLGSETWKHRQSAKENPQDGYNCPRQPRSGRPRSARSSGGLRAHSGEQAKKAPISSWDFVWNFHSLFNCAHYTIHHNLQLKCFKRRRAQLLSKANRVACLILW